MLVGTKVDLTDRREVTEVEALAIARRSGCPHYIVSAKIFDWEQIDHFLATLISVAEVGPR